MMEDENPFTFSKKLIKHAKQMKMEDSLDNKINYDWQKSKSTFTGFVVSLQSDLMTCYQGDQILLLVFARWQRNYETILHIQFVRKSDGSLYQNEFPIIKGKVTSITVTTLTLPNSQPTLYILLGKQNGIMEFISLAKQIQISQLQIESKPIVDIKIVPNEDYSEEDMVMALTNDFNILVISVSHLRVVGHFRPNIMSCDEGLSLCIHHSQNYMLQATKGGYLVLWKIKEALRLKFKRNENETFQQHQRRINKKLFNIFPIYILHSASLDGIIWVRFVGNLVALITKRGVFKLIAINIEQREQYACIFEHQIENGSTIKAAQYLQLYECLILVKDGAQSIIQCIFLSPQLSIRKVRSVQFIKTGNQYMNRIKDIFITEDLSLLVVCSPFQYFLHPINELRSQILQNQKLNNQVREIENSRSDL